MAAIDTAGVYGGIGGIVHEEEGMQFQARWEDVNLHTPKSRDIQWKELVAIYVMLEINKEKRAWKRIRISCDNKRVVTMVNELRAKIVRCNLQAILIEVGTTQMEKAIILDSDYIRGKDNFAP